MIYQALPEPTLPGALCVAPTGYGKTKQLEYWKASLSAKHIATINLYAAQIFDLNAQAYFCEAATQLGLAKTQATAQAIENHLRQRQEALWWFQDDADVFLQLPEVATFWERLFQHRPEQLGIVFNGQVFPNLDLSQWLAEGAAHYGRQELTWTQDTLNHYKTDSALPWTPKTEALVQHSQGWPLAVILAVQGQQQGLDTSAIEIQLQKRLSTRQNTSYYWTHPPSDFWQRLQSKAFKTHAQYWLQQAMTVEDLSQRRAHLYRSAGLSDEPNHQLKVLTYLAHQYLQAGQWKDCDRLLHRAEKIMENPEVLENTDRAAWYYLSANRARQRSHYAQAHHYLDQLQTLRGGEVTKFQTRAVQLRGLTYYQQGQYHQTEPLYQQALALADHDGNTAMQLEIHSMLFFLKALQENNNSPDEEEQSVNPLLEQVKQLPLTRQPLIYLNLVFAQILGERIDVNLAQTLLDQAKHIAEALNWDSLWPLIWDVEARLWRFLKKDEHALHLHQQAIERLEPESFAALYAQLNYGLTLLRQKDPQQGFEVLRHVLIQARQNGSQGLVREAEALLPDTLLSQSLPAASAPSSPSAIPAQIVQKGSSTYLRIQTFGGFQVYLNDEPVTRWPRKKSRHILIQLLQHSHSMHRETLADWLTGQDDLEQALRSLDVHIHALRKVLEPHRKGKQASQFIHFQDACYRFNRKSHYQWDAEKFTEGYEYWLKHKTNPENLAHIEKTLQLYQGPFLPELDFADLWQAEREHYQRQARELTLWCAQCCEDKQEPEQARAHLTRWLQWEPTCTAVFEHLFAQALHHKDLRQLENWGEQMEQTFIDAGEAIPQELKQIYQSAYQQLS